MKIPIGSTQKMGASVKGRRVPSVYDSSPILVRSGRNVNIVMGGGGRRAWDAQLESGAIRG